MFINNNSTYILYICMYYYYVFSFVMKTLCLKKHKQKIYKDILVRSKDFFYFLNVSNKRKIF